MVLNLTITHRYSLFYQLGLFDKINLFSILFILNFALLLTYFVLKSSANLELKSLPQKRIMFWAREAAIGHDK